MELEQARAMASQVLQSDWGPEWAWALADLADEVGEEIEAVGISLSEGDPIDRLAAAGIFRGVLAATASEALLLRVCGILANENDQRVISVLLSALAKCPDSKSLAVVLEYAQHSHPVVRCGVADALPSFCHLVGARDALKDLARDPDESVRLTAVFGLGSILEAERDESIIELLQQIHKRDDSEEVRRGARWAFK